MKIPLSEFEQHIDETILKRGMKYFKSGLVQEPDELSSGEFEFIVRGTEEYTVRLHLKDNVLVDQVCSCPYDLGPVCKHVAACLFFLQKEELGLSDPEPNAGDRKTATPKRGRTTVEEQVNKILDKITEADLKQFVRNLAGRNREFRGYFLSVFTGIGAGDSIKIYKAQIHALLKGVAGRHGFIEYRSVQRVGPAIGEYIDSARQHLENGRAQTAFFICAAVIEECVKAIQYSDDSDGIISGSADFAMDLLEQAASREIFPEEVRKEIFRYCLEAHRKKLFDGWDWHLDILNLAIKLVKEKKEYQEVFKLLDSASFSEYQEDRRVLMQLELLRTTNDELAVATFIKKNISIPKIREMAIEDAFSKKDYERAESLANDGIQLHKRDYPGYISQWTEYLLQAAQLKNENEKIIAHASVLFLDGHYESDKYYSTIKKQVPSAEWPAFLDKFIASIRKSKCHPENKIAWIYEKEAMWDKLMEYVRKNPNIYVLDQLSNKLAPYYAEELAELYEVQILDIAKSCSTRSHYKDICREIKKMKLLGAGDRVQKLLSTLRQNYKHRPALIEELSKL